MVIWSGLDIIKIKPPKTDSNRIPKVKSKKCISKNCPKLPKTGSNRIQKGWRQQNPKLSAKYGKWSGNPHVLYYLFMPNITTNHAITYTNFNLSEIKTVCAMLGVLLIAQKFEHIFLLTETRKVELCRCWEFVIQMEESYLNYSRNIKSEKAVGLQRIAHKLSKRKSV